MSDKWQKHREVALGRVSNPDRDRWVNGAVDRLAAEHLLHEPMDYSVHQRDAETIARLTRERDEARNAFENQGRLVTTLLGRAATPEMLRVVEAAKAWVGWSKYVFDGMPPVEAALYNAVDALAASQRKTEPEKDKYVVRYRRPDTFSWMVCIRNSDALSIWRHKADAEAECARLNAEASS